ncbi:class I SAM-dependent methyltransferase [Pseudomonas sp. 21LCFQ010]|uniref:class I SAM-dependent methyltransferase n=1 Tax=Pseudomonas sp. 21LCFQ010 TaxID=2957506 RepID=UPI00209827BC|nr:class I SAM-dependent methyltransferase [Pseudomonas sp. 21LCFQ010]MCO8161421.1 class I SAM-dependent methyltransferase [Pseudomonas sp. 21LCFQ010]
MITLQELNDFTSNPELTANIAQVWDLIGQHFEQAQASLPPEKAMQRRELSFHDDVLLLGYLSLLIADLPGDVVEIGVWKGKSLMLMNEACNRERRIIGIDPFVLPNQFEEFSHYQEMMLPNVTVLRGFSELSAERFYNLMPKVALLHIDGGHAGRNVLLDFLLYSPRVVPGGFIVFDDYRDFQHSPEVGPAVDLLRAAGYFHGFNILGGVHGFESSYVLQRM